MWEDPIVAEVRRARAEIEAECASDFTLIYQRALEVQQEMTDKLCPDRMQSMPEEELSIQQ
jgi:hypothetical protein